MEELILHYYLKVFNIALIIILLFITMYFYFLLNKNIILENNNIVIEKNEKIEKVLNKNIKNLSIVDILLLKIYFRLIKVFNNDFHHFGEFYFENNVILLNFLQTISEPSNIVKKITIIEGWSKYQLGKELSKYFENISLIPYEKIIADTYFIKKDEDPIIFLNKLNKIKDEYFNIYKNHEISKKYSNNEIMIIGSLIEKEGLDYEDKKKISSVIFNRLNINMKLQIDATVLYAITKGRKKLNRNLLYSDLIFDDPFNTYLYKGLPPKPISYVGKKTLDIIFENYKTDFLFYFFDNSLNRHIFSKNYADHKKKLNEYRNNQ